MSTDGTLDVEAVVAQFRDSEQQLAELRERLRAIVLAEEGAEHAAGSIDAASEQFSAAAKTLADCVEQIETARTATVDALKAAQTFLAGTDLTALRDSIAADNTATQAALTEIKDQIAALSARVPEVDGLRSELEALKGQLPARTRKKLGV